jgi:8-oxo-dGTP diphosphatase
VRRFAGVILVDPRGWILLQERDGGAPIDPDRWGLVGGHLDDGEEFESAAYRELAEETAVDAPPGTLSLWREFVVDHVEAHGSHDRMQVFVAPTTLTDADIVCGEGRQIVFVEPGAARGLPMTSAAADVVPEFLASDRYAELTRHDYDPPTPSI